MEFPEQLKKLRKLRNMTQIELANRMGYCSSTVSNYEKGKNQPSICDLKKLLRY